MVSEESLDPVVDMVWYIEPGEFFENNTMADSIKCFGKIECIDYDKRIVLKESCNCMEEVYESSRS